MRAALRQVARVKLGKAAPVLLYAATAQVVVLAALIIAGLVGLPSPQVHAYGAASWALLVYGAVHVFLAAFCAAFAFARVRAGYVSPTRLQELRTAKLFGDYACGVTLVTLLCLFAPLVLA